MCVRTVYSDTTTPVVLCVDRDIWDVAMYVYGAGITCDTQAVATH